MRRPKPESTTDYQHLFPVVDACEQYLDWLESDDYSEDSVSKYEKEIVRQALSATYGRGVFRFISEQMLKERTDGED